MSTIKISQLGNLTEALANVQIPMVANVAGTLTTVKGNVGQISSFVLGNLTTADLANISSNVSVLQSQVSTLEANAVTQAGAILTLTANAGAQSELIDSLDSNVGAQLGLIYALQDDVANLTANANAQAGTISTLTSNAASQGASISALESNISILISNAGAQSSSITSLQSNVDVILGNLAAQDSLISNIQNNVSSLSQDIDDINDSINGIDLELGNLIANASAQQEQINSLGAVDLESVESNISALFSAIGVHTGEIYDLQTNVTSQQTTIANITNGTATFGNLIPGANVTYSLGSPDAQWKELWVSGNTIHIGGQSITTTDSGIILTGNLATTGGVYEVAEFWDQTGFIGSGPWVTPPVLYETSYPVSSPAPSFITNANVAGYVSNVVVDYKGVYPYEQIDLYSADGISPLYDLAEPIEFVDILGEDVKPFGGANATSFADNITYTGTIYNGTVQIELTVSKIINAPATDDEFIDITVTNLVATGTTVADLIGRTVYIKNDGFVYDTLDATEINGTSELTLQDPAFYAKLTNPRTAIGGRISYYTSPVGQSNLVPASTNQAISTNTGIFNIAQVTGDLIVNGNVSIDGSIGFTMANFQHWTSNVSTISDALNQLAERIWNIENP